MHDTPGPGFSYDCFTGFTRIGLGVRRKVYSGDCLRLLRARGFRCRQEAGKEPGLAGEAERGTVL